MVANLLAAGFGAIASLVVYIKLRHDRYGRWFFLFAVGFSILAIEVVSWGRELGVSVGIVSLAVAAIAALTDVLPAERQR